MDNKALFASPKKNLKIEDCQFYHTMDIPGHGEVRGEWDLRGKESSYFGNIDFRGKSVLEMGTSSGHLCFWMEKQGARVVGYDLSAKEEWDIVPYYNYDFRKYIEMHQNHIGRMNNSFWFAHQAFNSNAKIAYGSIYEMPHDIGEYDIGTFGSILLHLRDPFRALKCVSPHIRETIVVTDRYYPIQEQELMIFLPNTTDSKPFDTWWQFTPEIIREYVRILGFEYIELTFHSQTYAGSEVKLFTCVGHREKIFSKTSDNEFLKYSKLKEISGGNSFIDSVITEENDIAESDLSTDSKNSKKEPSGKNKFKGLINKITRIIAPDAKTFSVNKDNRLSIRGWAVSDALSRLNHELFIQLVHKDSGNHYEIPACRQRRDEIENEHRKYAGFQTAIIEENTLEPGKYYIFALQIAKNEVFKTTTGAMLIVE